MPPHNMPTEPARPSGVRHWAPLVLTCVATFVLLIYATIVTVALPSITADLHASFSVAQWLIDGYTLALAGLLMGMGALGDAVGHRRLFGIGLWAFCATTLACGLAPGPGTLVAARIGQGLAAAALFGTLLPLIGQTYEGRERAGAFAIWGSVSGLGGAAGTLVGGVLAQYLSWRWIFLAAVPICAVTAVLAMLVLPRVPRRAVRIDVPGITTLTVAASAITFGVITAGDRGWASPQTLAGLAFGLVALGAFVVVERRTPAPVMPAELVRTGAFVGLLIAAAGYYFAAFGLLPPLSLWLQKYPGLQPLDTALVLSVQQVAFIATTALAGWHLSGLRMRSTIGAGTLIVGLGDLALVIPSVATADWPALLPGLVITGIGAGLVSPVLPAAAMAAASADFNGVAAGTTNCARQLGLALGVAVLGSVYHQHHDGLAAVFTVATAAGLVTGGAALAFFGAHRFSTTAAPKNLQATAPRPPD